MVTAHLSWQSSVNPYDPSQRRLGTCLCQALALGLCQRGTAGRGALGSVCGAPGGRWGAPSYSALVVETLRSPPWPSAENSACWPGSQEDLSPVHTGRPRLGSGFRGILQVIPADG